jgi:hypothetical protein
MHPYHHALSSVKKFGGIVENYMRIHEWFDETKKYFGDARHRALRHHTAGIFWCEEKFGDTITVWIKDKPREVPVRLVAEQHVMEDMGFLPTPEWWLGKMTLTFEMNRVPARHKDEELAQLARAAAVEMYKGEG